MNGTHLSEMCLYFLQKKTTMKRINPSIIMRMSEMRALATCTWGGILPGFVVFAVQLASCEPLVGAGVGSVDGDDVIGLHLRHSVQPTAAPDVPLETPPALNEQSIPPPAAAHH